MEELLRWEQDLLSKPLLLDMTAVHSKTDNYVYVRVTTRWRGKVLSTTAMLLRQLYSFWLEFACLLFLLDDIFSFKCLEINVLIFTGVCLSVCTVDNRM